ncbi:MAG: AbrB/MazE/SpoVT family DNA-binding domain-containing protein [Myxococcota bacterium]
MVKTKIVRIGNSQGVRIPKPLLEEAGLQGEVVLRVADGAIVIESQARPRLGWGEAAATAHERGDDELLAPTTTAFEESDWEWD